MYLPDEGAGIELNSRKEVTIMLRSLNELLGYILVAEDAEIGRCKD
jgi:hypothetical protein